MTLDDTPSPENVATTAPKATPPQKPPSNTDTTLGCIALLLVPLAIAFCIWFCCAGGPIAQSISQANAQSTATANVEATQTAQPTPTETPDQRILRLIKGRTSGRNIQITYTKGNLTITETLDTPWSNKTALHTVQGDIFDMQAALWTSNLHPQSVTIIINGPFVDRYGATSTGLYGRATLTAPTAARFHWDNLYQDTAWDVYDDAQLAPQLQGSN